MNYLEAIEAVYQGYEIGSETLQSEITLIDYLTSDEGVEVFSSADDWAILPW